jgi:hypothetical protein
MLNASGYKEHLQYVIDYGYRNLSILFFSDYRARALSEEDLRFYAQAIERML